MKPHDPKQEKGHHGPSPKEAIKNRLPISAMKEPIEEFLAYQKELYIAYDTQSVFPDLEMADFRYVAGKMILILTPASMFLPIFKDACQFTGFIFDKEGRGLKMGKRVYGQFTGKMLSTDAEILQPLAETDPMMKKMLSHGAKFFLLEGKNVKVYFGHNEIFDLDESMNPSFATIAPNGRKRAENSRHVLMEYEDREVIFNTFIENGVYYTLTKEDSNKVTYIKQGGECKFYDGRDTHFTSKITILSEEKVADIFEKLQETGNSFFRSTEGLIALSYKP